MSSPTISGRTTRRRTYLDVMHCSRLFVQCARRTMYSSARRGSIIISHSVRPPREALGRPPLDDAKLITHLKQDRTPGDKSLCDRRCSVHAEWRDMRSSLASRRLSARSGVSLSRVDRPGGGRKNGRIALSVAAQLLVPASGTHLYATKHQSTSHKAYTYNKHLYPYFLNTHLSNTTTPKALPL